MIIEIKHRYTGAVLWSGEAENLRDAVIKAVAARAYLADAYLAGANLAGANLAGADLARANLADAYLARAYLADARNRPASLASHVDPKEPYVRMTNLSRPERMLKYRERHPDVPIVENLDSRILEAVTKPGQSLDMSAWHTCQTTHCRAGWAIHLAGEAGYELEKKMRYPGHAGRAIYLASTGRAPWFHDSTENALADIRKCAEEEAAEVST